MQTSPPQNNELNGLFSDFLKHPEKKVLFLKGKWGVGKTYAWKNFIEANKEIKESAISYVSLFGVKDLKEVKQLIVQTAIPTNLKQFRSISKVGIPLVNALKNLPVPYLKDALETTDNIAALLVRKFLICFDDIERKADELSLAAILGLVSVLKEEKGCRIVLIFNEDEIDNENDKINLKKYREKIVDQEVAYEPSVKNNVQLIFQPHEFPMAQEVLQRLAINNIRIIKFTYWNAKHFEPFSKSLEKAVGDSFLENIAILTCLYYKFGSEINMENLPGNYFMITIRKKAEEKLTEAEEMMQQAQYSKQDFDPQIIEYLQTGKFNEVELKKALTLFNERELKNQTQQKLRLVWGLYNDNFQGTKPEVLKAFSDFVTEHLKDLAYGELKQICDLVTAIGHEDITQKWKKDFIKSNIQTLTIDSAEFFKKETSDPEVLEILFKREKDIQQKISLKSVVYKLVNDRSWNPKDEIFLNSFSEDDYYKWIETEKDTDLLPTLREFYRTFVSSGHNDIWKSVGVKFVGALKKLSQRSDLDRYRVQTFFNIS
jgi:KAP-like P-loop domain-containing protein